MNVLGIIDVLGDFTWPIQVVGFLLWWYESGARYGRRRRGLDEGDAIRRSKYWLQLLRGPLVYVIMPIQLVGDLHTMVDQPFSVFNVLFDVFYWWLFWTIDDDDFWGKRRRKLARLLKEQLRVVAVPSPA